MYKWVTVQRSGLPTTESKIAPSSSAGVLNQGGAAGAWRAEDHQPNPPVVVVVGAGKVLNRLIDEEYLRHLNLRQPQEGGVIEALGASGQP